MALLGGGCPPPLPPPLEEPVKPADPSDLGSFSAARPEGAFSTLGGQGES